MQFIVSLWVVFNNQAVMEILIRTFHYYLENIDVTFVRYLHSQIEWDSRLISILGSRGVGKTTLLLQHIKLYDNIEEVLYVSADDLYFTNHRLYDLALELVRNGKKKLYIDEIHKYRNWSQEIKNIYDQMPKLQVVYTGSSILELERGGADLSRRKLEYYLAGLSFREYLIIVNKWELPVYKFDDVIGNRVKFPGNELPLKHFKEYLQNGCYPFCSEKGYFLRLNSVINQIIENDIPMFAGMNIGTARKLRTLLSIIADSVPFKPNYTNIAKSLDVNRSYVVDFLVYLEKAGLIKQLRADTGGIKLLGKVDKVYLDNTNLAYALSVEKPDIGNLRETFFFSTMGVTQKVAASSVSDFLIDKYTFEVGGKNKKKKQIADVPDSYIVKDDIEYGFGNVLPLWAFGMTY